MSNEAPKPVNHHGYLIPRHLAWRTGRLHQFRETSDHHIMLLEKYVGLSNCANIVELGCGVGRDAIPLTKIVPSDGSYLGIDIIRQSIDWAQKNISSGNSNFEFVHFDIGDQQHNLQGKKTSTDFTIPRADGSQDLVFLYSVFTHMFPVDTQHYLGEFARILKNGGRVLASMFTMERTLIPYLKSIGGGGLRNLTFGYEVEEGFFHNDPNIIPGATAYSMAKIHSMIEPLGLELERFVKGSWRKDNSHEEDGQDLVIFKKNS